VETARPRLPVGERNNLLLGKRAASPDELVARGDVIYIRFHGKARWYRHDYSAEELAVWVRRIAESQASEAWIYFNNDREGFAIRNAQLFREMLGANDANNIRLRTAQQISVVA
jgi:uncharacterized protein YecE (DUF72 family)